MSKDRMTWDDTYLKVQILDYSIQMLPQNSLHSKLHMCRDSVGSWDARIGRMELGGSSHTSSLYRKEKWELDVQSWLTWVVTGPGEKPGPLITSLVLSLPQCIRFLFSSGPVPGRGLGTHEGVWFILLGTNSCPFCDCDFESNSEITKGNESLRVELFLKWALLF